MARSIWGFGSLQIRNQNNTISFTSSVHNLYFQKVNNRNTAITGKLHDTDIYFRPIIQANISICDDSNIGSLLQLIDCINDSVLIPMYVKPMFSITNTGDNEYQVYVDSKQIKFQQLANAQIGQQIDITFIGRTLVKLPKNTSNINTYYMWNGTDQFKDHLNNKIIVKG